MEGKKRGREIITQERKSKMEKGKGKKENKQNQTIRRKQTAIN